MSDSPNNSNPTDESVPRLRQQLRAVSATPALKARLQQIPDRIQSSAITPKTTDGSAAATRPWTRWRPIAATLLVVVAVAIGSGFWFVKLRNPVDPDKVVEPVKPNHIDSKQTETQAELDRRIRLEIDRLDRLSRQAESELQSIHRVELLNRRDQLSTMASQSEFTRGKSGQYHDQVVIPEVLYRAADLSRWHDGMNGIAMNDYSRHQYELIAELFGNSEWAQRARQKID